MPLKYCPCLLVLDILLEEQSVLYFVIAVSCSANQIPCNFTCVSNTYRCDGKVDCTNIPAGSDETKCGKC